VGSRSIDHRTDLWSLGVVVFYALTGRVPFEGENFGALAVAIHGMPIPVPSQVNPNLPASIDRWFAKACARNVDERFATARDMAAALRAAFSQEVPNARVSDPPIHKPPLITGERAPVQTQFGLGMGSAPPVAVPPLPPSSTTRESPASIIVTPRRIA